jgi:hypothetical protein
VKGWMERSEILAEVPPPDQPVRFLCLILKATNLSSRYLGCRDKLIHVHKGLTRHKAGLHIQS